MANKFTWIGTIVLTAAISNISAGIALADSSTIPRPVLALMPSVHNLDSAQTEVMMQ